MESVAFKQVIHTISSVLEIPVIIILLILVVIVVAQIGSILFEFFSERIGKKINVTKLIEDISGKSKMEILQIVAKTNLQKSQKRTIRRLLESEADSEKEQRLIAVQLLNEEETRLEKTMSVTDIIARIAPMFGLMSTLIPLGPGLLALGQGDTKGLADALLTAFDATVAGLVAAGIAFIISKVRKRWYQEDMSNLEIILEGVIE